VEAARAIVARTALENYRSRKEKKKVREGSFVATGEGWSEWEGYHSALTRSIQAA
jgi:hypothetical protein